MSWRDLLTPADAECVLVWVGGRHVQDRARRFQVEGRVPAEHGWHRFRVGGTKKAQWVGPAEADPSWDEGRKTVRGYLVGDRLIPDGVRVDPDPDKLIDQTEPIHLVELGLERFARAVAAADEGGPWIYVRTEFPLGPEGEVAMAFADRKPAIDDIAGVTPALDLAFRFCTWQRDLGDVRRQERLRREAEDAAAAERAAHAQRQIGTGAGRRELAITDFEEAARSALAISGAELLDHRDAPSRGEVVVLYRFRKRRFECVVERASLRVVDSGICLVDHDTGERGDTRFTLESLPAVVGQAMDEGKLVVFRHAR